MFTSELIGDMFYSAPALLHPLVRKCHNPDHEIPAEILTMLEDRELIINGKVPEHIRQYIVRKIKLSEEGGISMTL